MGVCHSKNEPKGPYNRLGETFKAQVRPIHSGAPLTPVHQGLCVSGGARAFSWALGVPSTAILLPLAVEKVAETTSKRTVLGRFPSNFMSFFIDFRVS